MSLELQSPITSVAPAVAPDSPAPTRIWSAPDPVKIWSAPAPPATVSSPPPESMVSPPAPPDRLSEPPAPARLSLNAEPTTPSKLKALDPRMPAVTPAELCAKLRRSKPAPPSSWSAPPLPSMVSDPASPTK